MQDGLEIMNWAINKAPQLRLTGVSPLLLHPRHQGSKGGGFRDAEAADTDTAFIEETTFLIGGFTGFITEDSSQSGVAPPQFTTV